MPQQILWGQICYNTPIFCIAAMFVKHCSTTVSWFLQRMSQLTLFRPLTARGETHCETALLASVHCLWNSVMSYDHMMFSTRNWNLKYFVLHYKSDIDQIWWNRYVSELLLHCAQSNHRACLTQRHISHCLLRIIHSVPSHFGKNYPLINISRIIFSTGDDAVYDNHHVLLMNCGMFRLTHCRIISVVQIMWTQCGKFGHWFSNPLGKCLLENKGYRTYQSQNMFWCFFKVIAIWNYAL